MIIFSEDLRGWPPHSEVGRIEIHVPESGVLICSGFDVEAMWVDSPSSVTVHYTLPDLLVLTCGRAVDNDLTVNQLKSICTQLGLSTSGLKADLLARVQKATWYGESDILIRLRHD